MHRILTRKKKTKSKNDERMKPSPSYTGPILTSLAALFAASGACVYAVNIQKIFGGMHRERERERERESSCLHFACVFFTLFIRRYQDPFFVLKLSLLLTTSFSFKRFIHDVNNNDLFAGSTPSTITNTEWLAPTQASYQNGVEREGAPGKPIALNPMRRNISP